MAINAASATGIEEVAFKVKRGLFPSQNDIEPIIAQAVIEEVHTDRLQITSHPVERGAPITDHSFKLPAELRINMGWSESGFDVEGVDAAGDADQGSLTGAQSVSRVSQIYESLLQLQASRLPFTVYTKKRVYQNMLMVQLTITNNQETENGLIIQADLQEIIITETQVIKLVFGSQSDPKLTAPSVNRGTIQPVIVSK